MKKLAAILMAIILVFTAAPAVSAAETLDAVAVTINGPESYTAQTGTNLPGVAVGFQKLIFGAAKTQLKPSDAKKISYVVLALESGKDRTVAVYKDSEGGVYVESAGKLLRVDAETFYRLADSTGTGFYKLRPVPSATVSSRALAITKSSYKFEKLDGKFYKSQFIAAAVPVLALVNGNLPIPEFSSRPKSANAEVTRDGSGTPVWSGALADLQKYKPDKAGAYNVKIVAKYDMPHANGEVSYGYKINFDSSISFEIDGASTNPGEVVVIRAKNIPENGQIAIDTDIQHKPKFFRAENGDMVALMPVSYYTAPGNHYVRLSSGGVTAKFDITAGNKQFVTQHLTVPPATAQETINSQKANDEYEKYIAPARQVSDGKRYWGSRFIWPLKIGLRVTTQFGSVRYTNGSKEGSRHGAVDLAAATGTPVFASGAGRVLYSGLLQLTGNTVVIEHGYGLKTWYYHMNSLNVKTGDMVSQGQKIGEVGSTGFSTGAHLHFGMSVSNAESGNAFVNPETAITTGLFDNLLNGS